MKTFRVLFKSHYKLVLTVQTLNFSVAGVNCLIMRESERERNRAKVGERDRENEKDEPVIPMRTEKNILRHHLLCIRDKIK